MEWGSRRARKSPSIQSISPSKTILRLCAWVLLCFAAAWIWATRDALQAVSTAAVRRTGGSQVVVNYWLRPDNTACVNGAAEFLRQMVQGLPQHIRLGLARGASALLSQPPASRRPLPPTKQRRDLN